MAILKIARMGHPVLRRRAVDVADPSGAETRDLIAHMYDTMVDAEGTGLAAPQVYESRRVVIFFAPFGGDGEPDDDGEDRLTVLINPSIEPLGGAMEDDWEGCLSVPGMRGLVPRYRDVRYSGIGPNGREIVREAAGYHARVVQHECDHLDGILYPQRMTDLTKLIFASEYRHYLVEREEAEVADD